MQARVRGAMGAGAGVEAYKSIVGGLGSKSRLDEEKVKCSEQRSEP